MTAPATPGSARQRASSRQAGFTLFELMVAGLVSSAVLLPAMALLMATLEWRDEAASRIALNVQAREAFDLLANGAARAEEGADGGAYAYGLRGREEAPGSGMREDYVLQFESNGFTVTGARFAEMAVACEDAGAPLPECAVGQTKTVAGYVSRDVEIEDDDQSVQRRTVEVTLTLTDPFAARRGTSPDLATQTYRGVFALNRDEEDED